MSKEMMICKLGHTIPLDVTICCDLQCRDYKPNDLGDCLNLIPYEPVEPEMPLIDEQDYSSGFLNDYGGGNIDWWQDYIRCEVGRCNAYWQGIISQHNEQLPAHDADVASKAVKEFAKKVDGLFLSKANLVLRGGGPDRWIITTQDWNSIVRDMAGKE